MTKQQVFNLNLDEVFLKDDFCICESNKLAHDYLFKFPNWENNILNIYGPKKCGKSFLLTIFAKINSFFKISLSNISKNNIDFLLNQEKLIIEDLASFNKEDLLFLIFNEYKNNNKFLIFSSELDTSVISFNLNDLKSRFRSVLNLEILNPTDHLLYLILSKQFSNRQIRIKKELLMHIVKKIDRTYEAVNEFVIKIDQESLSSKKKIDLKIINKVLSV
ncbi:MAG: DnaA/Hda family protein [Pelagibacteraceae bacterium]